ncbi:nuclear pore complex protein Nup214-like isoform X2 [Narcine bancroftii]|uniref:nuclear pore complex protein Nup214-like isoform X2 n=1 Tax=Narcine bancroftii TaxID=1343680 RepID=UPI003831198A
MGDGMASVPEREMKDFMFRQMKRIRVFESPDELPKDRVNLLVMSNIYGLTFMGGSSGLKILSSQFIALADNEEGSINEIIEDAPLMSVNMKLPVHHIALSCDDLTLSVAMVSKDYGLVIAFFDIRTFLNKEKSHKRPFVNYMPEKNCRVLDLKWNPVVISILAICMSDGSVTILDVTNVVKQHASLPATAGITSLCWSPKGKQLAAGRQNGTVVQYSPILQEKKVIPCPPFYNSDNPVKVLDIHWISTYVFAVVFAAVDGSLESSPELVIISLAKKDEKKEDQFLNFSDLCFGVTTERQHHYYIHYLESWDLLVASSAASIEVSVIARQHDKVNWELWVLEDAARAELPVTESSDDTMPVGVGIDFTSQLPVRVGDEKIYAPSPILMLLSTEGLLCPFHMLNQIPGMKTIVKLPMCPRIEGERELQSPPASIPAPSSVPPQTSIASQQSARIMQPSNTTHSPVFPSMDVPAVPRFTKHPVPPQTSKTKPEGGLADGTDVGPRASAISPVNQSASQAQITSSSTDYQINDVPRQKIDPSPKFVRFSEVEVQSLTNSSIDSNQQYSPEEEPLFVQPVGHSTKSFHGTKSSSAAMIQNSLGSTAGLPVPKSCPTQTSTTTKLSTSDLEKQLQQQPALDPVMMGIMEEIALFQKELDDLKARTASANFMVGSTKDMAHLKFDAESLNTFLLEIKEITESLHGDIGTLKTVMLEGFAAVEDATTQNQRSMDQNYLQLLRRKPLDPKSEAQLKEIRRHHQYVKFAVQDVNDVLDMEWEQYQEKNKKHKHLLLPEREVLFNALASHHEIINQQDKKINELINSLQNLRIYNQTSRWCMPNDKCLSDQCWNNELEMLRNVLMKTTLDTAPKLTLSSPGKLSPLKQSQLRNFLSKRQMPPVRSTAPANLSRSAFLSPKCHEELEGTNQTISALPRSEKPAFQTGELEESSFRHSPVARLPSFTPTQITAQSTPFGKVQPPLNAVPKSTGKLVKQGMPVPEKPVTSIPAAQAAAQAAVRRQMTNLTAVPNASLTEAARKNVPQVINAQVLKEANQSPAQSTISPSMPASTTEIIHQDLTKVPSDQIKPGPQKNMMKGSAVGPSETGSTLLESSSLKGFTFTTPTGGQAPNPLKSENITTGAPGPQVQKISSFPGASSGFHFTSPSTSSLNALNDVTLGAPASTKETLQTNFGATKPAFGLGTDVPFSFVSTKTISSSSVASSSTISGSSVFMGSDEAPEKQHATGAPTESATAGIASQTEVHQSGSEVQPSKPGTRSSMTEFQAPKVQLAQQLRTKHEMMQQQIPPKPKAEQQQLPKPEPALQEQPPSKPAAQPQQQPPSKPAVQPQQQLPPKPVAQPQQQLPPKPAAHPQQQPPSKPAVQPQQLPPSKPQEEMQQLPLVSKPEEAIPQLPTVSKTQEDALQLTPASKPEEMALLLPQVSKPQEEGPSLPPVSKPQDEGPQLPSVSKPQEEEPPLPPASKPQEEEPPLSPASKPQEEEPPLPQVSKSQEEGPPQPHVSQPQEEGPPLFPASKPQEEGAPLPPTSKPQEEGSLLPPTSKPQEEGPPLPPASKPQEEGPPLPPASKPQEGPPLPPASKPQEEMPPLPPGSKPQEEALPLPKPENIFFQGSTGGVTIGSFSGLVVNQTDDATKLDKSLQGNFTFAQTSKTSGTPQESLPFVNAFPLAKLDPSAVTTAASLNTSASMQPVPLFSSIPVTSTESSSLQGNLPSTLSSISKPTSAVESASSIGPVSTAQGSSFSVSMGSLPNEAIVISDALKLPEEKKEIGGSALPISSSTEKPTMEPKSESAGVPINMGTTSTPPTSVTGSSATLPIASSGASAEVAVVTESNAVFPHSITTTLPGSSGTTVSTCAAMTTQFVTSSQASLGSPHVSSNTPVPVFNQVENKDASFGQPDSMPSAAAVVVSPTKSDPTSSAFSSSAVSFGKPTFGQTTSVGFGQPASTSSAGFGFGQPTFGSPSVFGQPTSAAPSVPSGNPFSGSSTASSFSFGHPAASSGIMLGQSSAPAFGQDTTYGQASGFGSNTPVNLATGFGFQPSGFGGAATGNVFGQPSNTSSVFGQVSKGAIFGSSGGFFSGLGGKPSQDAATKNPFGQMNFGTVESQSAPNLFGNSGAKAFGFSSASFGTDQKSPGSFSAGSSVASQGFGSFSTPTKPAGSFGAAPVFGSPPAFGGAPTFGGSPAFGGAPAFSSPLGSSGGKVFGEGTAAASAGGFGFGSNPNAQTFGNLASQSNPATFGSVSQQGSGFGTQGTGFSGFGSSGGATVPST